MILNPLPPPVLFCPLTNNKKTFQNNYFKIEIPQKKNYSIHEANILKGIERMPKFQIVALMSIFVKYDITAEQFLIRSLSF